MTRPDRTVLVSATYVARRLGRDPRTVRRWIRTGTVPGAHIAGRWYVSRAWWDAVIATGQRQSSDTDASPDQ